MTSCSATMVYRFCYMWRRLQICERVCVCQWKTNKLSQSLIFLHRYKGLSRQWEISQPVTGCQSTNAMTAIAHIAINTICICLKEKSQANKRNEWKVTKPIVQNANYCRTRGGFKLFLSPQGIVKIITVKIITICIFTADPLATISKLIISQSTSMSIKKR